MDPFIQQLFLLLFLLLLHKVIACDLPESERFDCGYDSITRQKCLALNCCYDSSSTRCYYKTSDAIGGPIRHSNGLCIFPKNNIFLVWSTNCFSKNAMFLVSHDYPIRHIVSGNFILPPGKNNAPGDSFSPVLRSTTSNAVKFRRDIDGNLRYFYLDNDYGICLTANPEPMEGDLVIFVKPCIKLNNCQHLNYVYETGIKRWSSGTISCPANSLIQVAWANYGERLRSPNLEYKATEYTTNTTTKIIQRQCNTRTYCTIVVSAPRKQTYPSYLIVRHTCLQISKPAAPTKVTIGVLGMNKLKVTWFPMKNKAWYSICWKTLGNDEKCNNGNITSSNAVLDHLEPSTKYFVRVASRNCDGGIGYYSEPTIGITSAGDSTNSNNIIMKWYIQVIISIGGICIGMIIFCATKSLCQRSKKRNDDSASVLYDIPEINLKDQDDSLYEEIELQNKDPEKTYEIPRVNAKEGEKNETRRESEVGYQELDKIREKYTNYQSLINLV